MSNEQLKPCPFCGCEIRLESNRDWHRLQGDHEDGFRRQYAFNIYTLVDFANAIISALREKESQP